ncbi:MAG: rhodanese-like domain-containing protein [Ardenticatenaceae bacterium]|nr:rhodanese-like domain-containing protein [Ardenticatenaceae bacterium]MCB8989322.1 rhodanese-like domain-containing protein [Ardenticatenaceae bacterium]
MNMKRLLLVLFLMTAVLLTITACGGNTNTVADTVDPNAPLDLAPTVNVATVAEVKDRDDVFVIDVREQWEYDEKHIPGVTLIPLGTVPDSLNQIPQDKTVIVTCRSGNRSGQAVDFLRTQGFTNVHNMEGGIVAWESAGYPVEP